MRVSRAWVVRVLLPAALFSLGGAALVGCKSGDEGGGGGSASGGGSAGGTGDILVGHFASLKGKTATFGIETDQGVRLAMEELNAAGGVNGRKFRVETQDDRSLPEEAKTVVERFAANDRIVAVLGEVASTRSLFAAPVLQRAKIPMISPSSTNPEVTRKGDYIFRVCFIDPFQGYVMAKFALENLKIERAAILRDQQNDYSVGLADVFRREFEKMGGRIVADASYKEGDADFRAQLAQIKAANPEGLYVPGYYGDIGTIARQARETGITAPLMGGDGWDSSKLVEGAGGPGKALEGCYFSNHYSKDDKSERVQNFVKAYAARYKGETPSGLAALGYDAMMILADAIKRAGSTDRKAIRDALAATQNFPGVTGDITIDEERNARKPAVVLQIQGNQFVYRENVEPSGPDATASAR